MLQYIRNTTAQTCIVLNPEIDLKESAPLKHLEIKYFPFLSYKDHWLLIHSIPIHEASLLLNQKQLIWYIMHAKKWNLFLIHLLDPERLLNPQQMFDSTLLKSDESSQMRKTF